jgi:hypothetical protein
MKARFCLALLAFNGLFLGTNSASAFTESSIKYRYDITNLSRTIAELVKFDPDTHSLVEMAIDRALIAQKAGDETEPKPLLGVMSDFPRDLLKPPTVGTIAYPDPPPTTPEPRSVTPEPPHPDRELKRTSGAVNPLQPLAPDKNKPIDRENVTPKPQSIDRSSNIKKLSECKAPMSDNTESDNTNPLPVSNSSNPNQPKVPLEKIVKPSTPPSTQPTDKVAAPLPTPPVRHVVGARG